MIFCGCIAVLCPLVFYFKYANTESVLMDTLKVAAIFAVFFLISLYMFLYALIYRVETYTDRIIYRSLFRKVEISINTIKTFKFIRYYKTGFYQYKICYANDKHIKISTKHNIGFTELLKGMGAEQIL